MVGKRGQITIFIIIGIAILLSAGVYFYATSQAKKIDELPTLAQVPTKLEPVKIYVESCLSILGADGLKRIGDYGGYTDVGLIPDFNVDLISPTESDGVQFTMGSELIIPYWYYLKSPNKCEKTEEGCQFDSKRPNLYRRQGEPSIEGQLDRFVETRFRECINDFEPLRDQGYDVVEKDYPEVTTQITNNSVLFLLNYPLTVRFPDQSFSIENFMVDVDVPLRKIYTLATNITNLQKDHAMFARHTRNIIEFFSRLDEDMLPPTGDLDFNFGQGEIWIEPNVKEQLQQLLTSYIPLLQVFGTENYEPLVPDPSLIHQDTIRSVYNRGMIVPILQDNLDLDAYFTYLDWWPIYFDLNCNGAICTSEGLSVGMIPGQLFGIQKYNFAYDVSFPVMVEVYEDEALQGQGYTFKFMLEANMRNNQPLTADYVDFKVPVYMPVTTSLLCDSFYSPNVTITAIDGETGLMLDDVQITYTGGVESCPVGRTANGTLRSSLPIGVGGILGAFKPGYASAFQPIDTDGPDEQSVELVVEPYRYVDVSVGKLRVKKSGGKEGAWVVDLGGFPEPLHPKEEAFISLKRITGPAEEEFMTFAEVTGNIADEDMSKDMRIVPGTYEVRIDVLMRDDIYILNETRTIEGETFTLPGVFFTPAKPLPSGSTELIWEVTNEDLRGATEIEFHVVNFALDLVPVEHRVIEDLAVMGDVFDKYNVEYQQMLKPTIKYRAAGRPTLTQYTQ